LGAFIVSALWLLLFSGQWAFLKSRGLDTSACRRRVGLAFVATAFGLLGGFVFAPTLKATAGKADLEVLKDKQVGIYNVKVIQGDSAEPVMDWLESNGFAVTEDDRMAFDAYTEQGWCFVAAQVRPDPNDPTQEITIDGLAAPLVLTFPADKPIYPLALTATAGPKTEILLHTVSDTKLTCEGRLKLRSAGPVSGKHVAELFSVPNESNEWEPIVAIPDGMMTLCKFKGTMTAAQMARDLEFEPADDNEPFRERRFVW
jgi:hypothetical protein